MRSFGFALTTLLLAGAVAGAQTTPAAGPTPTPAADSKLDDCLKNWEASMARITVLTAELGLIEKDPTFKRTTKLKGYAQYMRSGSGPSATNLARMKLWPDGKTEADYRDQIICTGAYIYRFEPSSKVLRAYEIPKPKPGAAVPDNMLSFLFGMKFEEAKKRYDMKVTREDAFYYYIDVAPRMKEDASDFVQAELVLSKANFLPRQLWFKEASGNETTWDVPRVDLKSPIARDLFDAPRTPAGWKLEPVRADERRPTVIRN
jgi:TIGR03009 family protein